MPTNAPTRQEFNALVSKVDGLALTVAALEERVTALETVEPPPPPPPPPPTGLREIDGGADYFAQFTNSLPSTPDYFPIGVWFESILSQEDVDKDKDAGLNLYVVLTSNSNLSLLGSNGMKAILQQSEWRNNSVALANTAVAGWELYDEIDMQAGPPDGDGYAQMDAILASLPADGRFRYNNYGKGVMFWESDIEAAQFVNKYQHVTSDDIYWFTDPNLWSGSEGGVLLNNGNPITAAQARLAANYGKTVDRMRFLGGMDGILRPTWNFVEVGWPMTETASQGGRAIAPAEIRAAVWHSIIAGARGIIYFNHSFGGPNPSQHCLRDPAYAEQRAAVKSTNALIKQLAPVLNAPFDDGFVTAPVSVRAMTKLYNGVRYIFAGATGPVSATPQFTLAGITSGTATVIDEGRTIPIADGKFSDTFTDGNAIHIYRIG